MAKLIKGVNDLATLYPTLASEWDYEKNYPLTPDKVTAHSNKKVWWICKKGHSWRIKVSHRTDGSSCPYCLGRRPVPGVTSLDVLFPEVAAEWDYEKNYPYTPQDFTARSGEKAWWTCKHGHSWKTTIACRTNGNSCPYCTGRRPIPGVTSLDALFPEVAAEWDYERNYPYIPYDFTAKSHKKVWWVCKKGHSWPATIANRTSGKSCPYCSGRRPIPGVTSLDVLFPEVAAEWDYEKNHPYTPQDFTAKSHKRVWWICKKGHSWSATIADRTRRKSCPYCAGQRSIPGVTSLDVLFPEIAREFDFEKNYPYIPQDFAANSGKKIWWRCKNGHSWRTRVCDRVRGRNCPYCV